MKQGKDFYVAATSPKGCDSRQGAVGFFYFIAQLVNRANDYTPKNDPRLCDGGVSRQKCSTHN